MTKRSVAVVIHDGVQALHVAGLLEVFAEANTLLPAESRYDVVVIGPEARAFRAANGLAIVAERDFTECPLVFDTVVVAGGESLLKEARHKALHRWLGLWGSRAGSFGAVGTGAFALAWVGLLDGKSATTDPSHIDALAAMFPAARLARDCSVVRDGALITSGAIDAGINLALELVRDHHGLLLSLGRAPGVAGAPSVSEGYKLAQASLPQTHGRPFDRVVRHIIQNLGEPLPVERMAALAGVSPRSLARLFASELGVTPHEYVEGRRLDLARRLLTEFDLRLKVVAHRCGFGGAEQMRVVFQRRLGLSPAAYRNRMRGERVPRPGQSSTTNAQPRPAGTLLVPAWGVDRYAARGRGEELLNQANIRYSLDRQAPRSAGSLGAA